MDMKLELVMVPVTDVDRAREFYEKVGFHTDHDQVVSDEVRFVQMTPPGSACSIAFGTGITETAPGSARGLQIVVDDVARAREELTARGVETGDVQHLAWGDFIGFTDPDGNQWAIQQLPPR